MALLRSCLGGPFLRSSWGTNRPKLTDYEHIGVVSKPPTGAVEPHQHLPMAIGSISPFEKKKKKHGKTSRFTTSRMSKKLHLLHQLCTNPQPPKNAEGGSLPWNELRNLGRSTTPHGSARDIPPHGTSAALGSAWGNHLVLIYIHPQYCWTPKPPAPV